MKLVTAVELAQQYGLPRVRVHVLLRRIPIAQRNDKRQQFYQHGPAHAVIQQYIKEKAGPPEGLIQPIDFERVLGLSFLTRERMLNHPDMPPPAGQYRNNAGQMRDYYAIDDVMAFANSRLWVGRGYRETVLDEDDDQPAYAIPSACYLNPWAKAFVSWDFKSPLVAA